MSALSCTSFLTAFATLPDPRMTRRRRYPLLEILFLCVSASLSGYEEWQHVVDFGRAKLAWLRTYLPFAAGIPSHDTLNRVMGLLEPRAFEQCLICWARRDVALPEGAQICLDGKRLCRSATARQQQAPHAQGGVSAVHLLHAWCDEAGLCLGQYHPPDKTNEITALPELLALLEVGGCLLTMDAIGCQKSVTQAIAAAGADYLLALKGNQAALQAAVQGAFAAATQTTDTQTTDTQAAATQAADTQAAATQAAATQTADTQAADTATDTGEKAAHGRRETRTCRVLPATALPAAVRGPEWAGLRTVVEVVATRTVVATGVTTTETRLSVSSRQGHAIDFQKYVRRHWGIENRLHWVLDVVFGEDRSRKRARNAAANCAVVRKFALNLLRARPENMSLNRKRNHCALSDEYREKCLGF